MKRGTAIRKTPGSSIGGVSEEEKKKSSSTEDRGRALTFPPTALQTIQFPNDPARPLKASSQRPSSQARVSTKFIVLSLLGLGLLTSTVKGAPQIGTLQLLFRPYKNSKITKLKKKKKKTFFYTCQYWSVLSEIGRYGWYLNQYETLTFRYRYTHQYGTNQLVRYRLPCIKPN